MADMKFVVLVKLIIIIITKVTEFDIRIFYAIPQFGDFRNILVNIIVFLIFLTVFFVCIMLS